MWLAAVLGLGMSLTLNLSADRLPRGAQKRAAGASRVLRWFALGLIETWLWAWLQARYGWSAPFVRSVAYCSLLLLIAAIDLEHRLVLDVLVGPGLALAVLLSALWGEPGLVSALEGAALGGGFFLVLALVGGRALGMGDVKLALLIGTMTGFPWVLEALTLGVVLAGVVAGLLVIGRVRGLKDYVPYAPYLVAGGLATLLYGQRMWAWYLRLARGRG
jgi:leader peptidase (prepilin peptidase)/N-methyltransferase